MSGVQVAAPFSEREFHLDACPGCGHVLGIHAGSVGCVHGWTYDPDGFPLTEGCDCPLSLASTYDPPSERDL